MSIDNCDPAYNVKFYDRGGNSFDAAKDQIVNLDWHRKLDDQSDCNIDFEVASDECCQQLGKLEPYAHEVEIIRGGSQVWYGWILDVDYGRSEVNVNAFDALGWLKKRIARYDRSFQSVDLSDIFSQIWHDAMDISPVRAQILTSPTAIRESRDIKAADKRLAFNIVKEMLDTGLDATAFGQTVLAGIIHTTKPIELLLSEVSGDVRVSKAGSKFADKIYVDANADVTAEYPPGNLSGNSVYPLVEGVIRDSQIQDVQSALNAAKAQYESFGRRPPRLISASDSLILQPNSGIKINDLIPGTRVVVDTTGLCYAVQQEFRLGGVDVTVSGGSEQIALSLQPTGPTDSLSDTDDPVN